jgi:hypothetical protein
MLPPAARVHPHDVHTYVGYRHHPTTGRKATPAFCTKTRASPRTSQYRPVGLLNTIYKLYTRTVTMALYDYAEKHSVLSSTQKGFRKYASTMSQVQTLIMALEDARDTAQDVYMLQVDLMHSI